MNEERPIDSDRLARYVSGEADEAERDAVERWAAAAPENLRELEAMRSAWEVSAVGHPLPEIDVDAAWARVRERMEGGGGRVIPMDRSRTWTRWLAVAAVLAGLVFAAGLFFRPAAQEVVAHARPVTATLSDSSEVVVSPGSEVRTRMDGKRRVELQGQAYFEVKRDERRPFIVQAGDVRVTVLGTAFEVSAYDTSATVKVRVRHGRVRVEAGGDTMILSTGQHVRFERSGHLLVREPAPPMEVWAGRIIQFEQAPLPQVVDELERIFHVRIQLANERLSDCRLTATFEDEPIDAVLRVIADTFGLRVENEGAGGYVIDGDGC